MRLIHWYHRLSLCFLRMCVAQSMYLGHAREADTLGTPPLATVA
jgi:hypothetical protein